MKGVTENRSKSGIQGGGDVIFFGGFLNVPLIGSFLWGEFHFFENETRQV